MNKIYKVIWSKVRNCYVAVSEFAKRNGKSCTSVNCGAKANRGHAGEAISAAVGATLLAGVCSVLLPVRVALAAPVMPTLDYKGATADVTIASTSSNTAATMNITSTKTNNVLKWIDFSIGKGGAVNFTDAHNYLNYVTGHGRSEIDGTLTGAGKIYIVNPNGVLFGDNARVDVGSLYVSTRELGADQFSAFEGGNNPLTAGDIKGDVVNLGKLNATNITVEGNNISFKNVADVTKGGTLTDGNITGGTAHNDSSVTLTANSTGEIHIGSSNGVTPDYSMNGTSKTYMYKLVSTPNELQAIGNNDTTLAGNYMLANDIDLKNGNNYYLFKPIGYTTIYKNPDNTDQDVVFKGRFDGLNYIIKNLRITNDTLPSDLNMGVGLFGYSEGTIENVGVVDTYINVSKKYVGGVVGYNHKGTVRNVYHTGSVSGESYVGGISGYNYGNNGYIEKAFNSGTVTANADNTSSSDVYIGGIVGSNVQGKIREVYNTGDVGTSKSYNSVGGIAGRSYTQNASIGIVALIENSYNTGTVKGYSKVGGIAGSINNDLSVGSEMIKNTYNTGTVEGETTDGTVGGLVGYRGVKALITSSYFNNGNNNGYGTLRTNQEMHDVNTYSGWSISTEGGSGATWRLYQGINGSDTNNRPTPLLTAFLKPKDLVQVYEYDGNEHMFRKDDPLLENDTNIKHSGVAYPNWKPISLKDAGVDDFSSENGLFDKKVFYSLQNGYDIADMKLIIQPKRVAADFNSTSEVYKGSEVWEGLAGSLAGVIPGDEGAVSVTSTATFADKNVGTGKTVTYSDITLDGDKKDNYIVVDKLTGTGAITKKELTLVADKVSIKKDGTVPSNFTGRITGFVPGESLGAGDTLTFALTKDETPAAVGFYGVTGKLNDASNGDYGTNYTFTNDPANASAFSIVVGVMPKLDFKGASSYVTIASTPDTMNITSLQTNNVLKWMDFSIDKDGKVIFDTNNYLNYVTGHGRSEIDGTLTGGGNIYLINPNGMVFGSTAQVNVGNLYLSTRDLLTPDKLTDYETAVGALFKNDNAALGDVTNLGKLNTAGNGDTNIIQVEGKNISIKNIADVTKDGAITNGTLSGDSMHDNVKLTSHGGEIHLGFAVGEEATTVNDTQYTNVTPPSLDGWTTSGITHKYMLVRNAFELQNMKNNVTKENGDYNPGNYMLANDIEFRKPDNSLYIEHFQPIGRNPSSTTPKAGMFQGRLDGLNHVISDITIDNVINTENYSGDVGMIGSNAGVVENLGVINGEINVPSFDWVGGIVGANKPGGIIRNVYFTGSVTGSWGVGGIAGGQNQGSEGLPSASIEKAYNAGKITGRRDNSNETYVGGIVGINWGTIKEAYNTGTISYAGTKGTSIGGIAGKNENNGTLSSVENVYNAGIIIGTQFVGGIVGNHQSGTIKYAYNTGRISGDNDKGGIVGYQYNGSVDSSYFTKGGGSSGIQIDDSELKQFNTFAGSTLAENQRWDMSQTGGAGKVWRIYEGQTAPLLTAFLKTKDVITETEYNGTAQSFDENLVTGDSHIYATVTGESGYATQTNAGKYDGLIGGNVLYSDQLGYDLVDTKLIIQPKKLTATFGSNTYNGTAVFTGVSGTLSDVIPEDATYVTVTSTATYNDKNAGAGKSVSYSDIALDGTKKDNYVIVDSLTGTGTITPAPVTISVNDYTRTYDGTTDASGATLVITNGTSNALFGTDSASGGTKTFDTKNVVEGKNKITVSDVTINDGNEGKNYAITYAQNTNSKITPANLTLTAEDVTKTYDGTTSVTGGTLKVKSGTLYTEQGDSLSGGTFAFTNKNVGTGNKVVTVTDATISDGNGGENYNVKYENNTTSTIMTKALSVGNVTKEYDGTDKATLTVDNLIGLVGGDKTSLSISEGVTANYTGENASDAGGDKTVNYSGLEISGTASGNYTIAASGTSTTSNSITARLLTMGSVSKVYDGTDNALVTVYALTNAIEDDLLDLDLKISETGSATYSDKNVGNNLTVTYKDLILSGAKAGNYTIDSDAVVPGNSITPKELTLVADKVSIKSGETIPTSFTFTGNVIGFVGDEGLVSPDDLKFELATPGATMAGSYAIVGKLKDSKIGDYLANGVYSTDNTSNNYNYTFSNAPANEKAFTIAVDVMPQLDYRGASVDVTIDTVTTANTMAISSIQSNNVLKWIDFSIGSGGTVQFDANNYLNYVTGHGCSEIYGTLTGGGDIYLINPNGMVFGSTAQVNVGNLYLSTRSFDVDDELDDKLNNYLNSRTIPTGSTILGDVTNLGKLNTNGVVNPNTNVLTNTIEVEGRNISIKNIADVTTGGTLTNGTLSGGSMHNNVKLTSGDGEIHLGFAVSDTPAERVNDTQYTNVTPPSLEGWTTTGTTHKYMLVHNAYELQNINNKLTGNYMLANDIDFIDENGDWTVRYFKSLGSKGNNWGSRTGMFQGRLDGLNHVIRNINITNTNNESYSTDVGIIGSNAGIVENFGVVNGNIVLSSKSWVGGIVGANKGCGIIRNVYFSGLVEGSSNVGGIAGAQDGSNTQPGVPLPGGIIEKAYASGTVRSNNSNGGSYVGGIVGSNGKGARVSEAYNSANVSTKAGGRYTGGIVGSNSGTIVNAYNTGAVEGGTYVGGIAGSNSSNSSNSSNIIIQNTYNTGTVSGTSNFGGIVGYNSGTAPISSFFTQGNDNDLGKQISDSELKEFATFAGSSLADNIRWDMSKTGGTGKVWRIYEGQTGPLLTAFLKTKDVVTATEYNGSEQEFDNTLAQGAANHIYATDSGNLVKGTDAGKYLGNNTDNAADGYKVFYSNQQGYDIVDTILVIQPKRVSMNSISNVYDGNVDAIIAVTDLDGVVGTDTSGLTVNATSATFADKNVGENIVVTYSGLTLSGTKAENYVIAPSATGTGTINKKQLTVTFDPIRKTYDGTTDDVDEMGYAVASRIGTLAGVVAGEESKVSVSGTATYVDKNVSNSYSDYDKTVNYSGLALGAGTGGDESANYELTSEAATGNGRIDKANVTLTAADVTKTYDGTTDVTGGTLVVKSGTIFNSDSLSGGAFAFEDKNAGKNKTVTVSSGSATITDKATGAVTSGNYNITYADNMTSTISQADVTLTAEAVEKTYDGSTEVAEASRKLKVKSGTIFTGDSVSGGVFAFEDKNAGTGKVVTISGATISDGTNSGNYNITYENNTTSTITPKAITVIFADINKTYDGTTADTEASRTGTLKGVEAVDDGKVSVSASAAYDKKDAGSRTVNYTGITLSGAEAANYSIATTATGNGTIGRKALELVADPASTEYGDYNPASFTGRVDGFVTGESVSNGDTLLFALSDPSASAVGSYGITGTINGSSSGDYGLNYTFTNAASNANAFTIYARPASVQDMVLSDIIPGIKGMTGANISVTALDNSLEQATDKKAEVGIEFAVAQTILSVDADRNLSLENQGMKQPPAMTPQEVAEQVHAQQGNGNGVAAQASGNAGAASAGANENGAASNAGVAGAVNAAMDVVQQTDNAVGTEESKRKKGVA